MQLIHYQFDRHFDFMPVNFNHVVGSKVALYSTSEFWCNVRQKTLQKFLKISIKNSKCATSNKHIQDGRPGRYENRRGSKKKAERCQTQPERQALLSLAPEETQKRLKRTKPRVVSYPQRMSWKVRRRSTIRRWFARRLWKLYENQHVLSFSVHW